eukprot:GHVL01010129.1.p1 GENE.GHVL01010129.1~~GHVL01010129.1.p1  ORF type:complete len:127 (+),score=28.10 GHVL01010129.1:48-383(+)
MFEQKGGAWLRQLEEELEHLLLITLRDGRVFIGYMRTYDQFGNIVIEDAHQRMIAGNEFADIYMGIIVIRGENLAFFGEYDEKKLKMTKMPLNYILSKQTVKLKKQNDEFA